MAMIFVMIMTTVILGMIIMTGRMVNDHDHDKTMTTSTLSMGGGSTRVINDDDDDHHHDHGDDKDNDNLNSEYSEGGGSRGVSSSRPSSKCE